MGSLGPLPEGALDLGGRGPRGEAEHRIVVCLAGGETRDKAGGVWFASLARTDG